MIEKLKQTIKGFYDKPAIPTSIEFFNKINEVVDAVNELKEFSDVADKNLAKLMEEATRAENVQKDTESGRENVPDPYAEQRQWIGKLCKFWDFVYDHYYFDTLKGITDKGLFIGHNGSWEHCEPVKPDDDIIYKGGDNE